MIAHIVPLTLLFLAAALTSYLATGIVRRAATRVGLVDRPDERKVHLVATPRLGGLAIIFGFGFPLLLLAADPDAAVVITSNLTYFFAVLAAGSLVVGLGVYDDLVGTNAPKKFALQGAAAAILVIFGFSFDFISLAGHVFQLGFLGVLASIVWIVGVINAMNFIDGIDSLATVVAITVAVAFATIAVLRNDLFSLMIMVALSGSLIGFYPWNRPPAKIFMGDTGSMFIGLMLAACSIARPSKSPTALIIGGPMLALALPVLDTLLVMRTRMGGQQASFAARLSRLFTADRNHIHHILIARHGSVRQAIVRIWGVTLLFAVAAVLTVIQPVKLIGYSLGVVALIALLALRYWTAATTKPEKAPEVERIAS
jgi:UDP-GlcNAc:undecaprenyl-phosphate/decaprenyl-phosphate GlcNAc-1-phosphate transferase